MRKTREHAYASITHQNRLLVFRHGDVSEAERHVPARTSRYMLLDGLAVWVPSLIDDHGKRVFPLADMLQLETM